MKTNPISILSTAMLGGAACCLAGDPVTTLIDAPPPPPPGALSAWPGSAPDGCPYPQSEAFRGLHFTGRHVEYTGADTWYPSWAADGNLYSPWTDGNVNGLTSGSGGENAATGHATILGDDPLKLTVIDQGIFKSSPRPYEGRYPCGSLVHDGVWYYGTYCLHSGGGIRKDGIIYNWPWLGPFVGFRWSTDLGKTWHETPRTPANPLFGEHALNGEPVKLGAPHFVDFGKAMEHSPDGKAYLVGHGASDGNNRRYAFNSWITADQAYLVRVRPAIETMNDPSKYEFFAGHRASGEAEWTGDFGKIKPIAEWRDHAGCVTITYNAPLRKYLMLVTSSANIAPLATVTVTSTHADYSTRGLTDGIVGGFPGAIQQEWCSNGERGTATVRLTWNEEREIDRVWLFDRPNDLDQIRSGLLVFSDGSTIETGELPDDAKKGLEVKFPPKRVKWLVFIPNDIKPSTQNIGLAEIAVFRSP